MADEAEVRRRLVQLYDETGNENYLRAADQLNGPAEDLPLLWYLSKQPRRRGRRRTIQRGQIVRMGLMIACGEAKNPYQAACKEVDNEADKRTGERENRIHSLCRAYRDDPPDDEVRLILEMVQRFTNLDREMRLVRVAAQESAELQRYIQSITAVPRLAAAIVRRRAALRHPLGKNPGEKKPMTRRTRRV